MDCGTQGIRGIIFDPYGNVLAKAEKSFEGYYASKTHFYEAPGTMFWDDLTVVTKTLVMNCPELIGRLAGMTLAAQRDTATIVDWSGKPLRDFISWKDRRVTEKTVGIPLFWQLLFFLSGKKKLVEMFNRETHAHWIQENEPELWKKAHRYIFLSTYLFYRLTGRMADAVSNMAGHIPFDYRRKKWCGRHALLAQIIQIGEDKRCELIDSCEIQGYLTKEAAETTGLPEGLLVLTAGTDKGCETLGTGCISPQTASVSLGTQATVEITSKRYFELVPFYPPFPAVDPSAYNPEITIYDGFWMINWFIDNFMRKEKAVCAQTGRSLTDYLDRKLKQVPAGAGGLLLQPFWGNDSFRQEARGSIIGFTEEHDRFFIYRSIIEGLAYALREGIEQIERHSHVRITSVGLSGGGSRSDVIAQIMADVFNVEVYRVQTFETTGLGAAMAAYVGLGHYRNLEEAGKYMVRKSKRFFPDKDRAALYHIIYKTLYKKAYRRYRPLYRQASRINFEHLK